VIHTPDNKFRVHLCVKTRSYPRVECRFDSVNECEPFGTRQFAEAIFELVAFEYNTDDTHVKIYVQKAFVAFL
jgi:hypothetical protein